MTNETKHIAERARIVGALVVGALSVAIARNLAPLVRRHALVREGLARRDRALHVLKGKPIVYKASIKDGTLHMGDQARIDTVEFVGGPPRVDVKEMESIFADALIRARAAAHQPPAIHVNGRTPPGRTSDDD